MPMPPEFKLYAICSSILALQALFLGAKTAATRARHKGFLNPEDGKVSFADAAFVDGREHPDTARVQRAHRNLLEALPLFYALGLIYVLAGAPTLGATICFLGFTLARVLHTVAYLNALQPWRTIFFALGMLSLVAMIVLTMITILGT
jgi:prostaglandin-E synthase 1